MRKILILIISLPLLLLGAEWQSLDGPPLGRADDMSMGEYEGLWVIYAADKIHKLYKSTNEGEHWDSIYLDENIVNPTCVITDENNAQIVYIGKNDATPVWKSINGGETWVERSTGITNPNPLCFAMDPNNSSKIYLGCCKGACALFKTEDGGATWVQKPLPISPVNPDINDIAITHEPLRGTWIIVGCSNSQTLFNGIWLSTDGGDNWDQTLSSVNIYSIDFAHQFTGYAGSNEGVYKTEDGGMHWTLLPNSPQYIKDLKTITTSKVYAATGSGMFMTEDGGDTWVEINEGICARRLSTVIARPDDSQTLFAGGRLSIYKTTNSGVEWSEITKGFKLLNFKISDFESNTFDYVDKKADYNDVSIFSQQTHKDLK